MYLQFLCIRSSESRGLEVCLVNAQHVKNVPGRKTDVSDCQWLQYLHSVQGCCVPASVLLASSALFALSGDTAAV